MLNVIQYLLTSIGFSICSTQRERMKMKTDSLSKAQRHYDNQEDSRGFEIEDERTPEEIKRDEELKAEREIESRQNEN